MTDDIEAYCLVTMVVTTKRIKQIVILIMIFVIIKIMVIGSDKSNNLFIHVLTKEL